MVGEWCKKKTFTYETMEMVEGNVGGAGPSSSLG